MPHEIKYYACSNCGKIFKSYKEALEHEQSCDRCRSCEHAFYVYGCEFDCKFIKECRYPTYEHYKLLEKN